MRNALMINASASCRTAAKAMQLLILVNAMLLVGCYQGKEYAFIDVEVAVPEALTISVGDTFECFEGTWQVVALEAKPSLRVTRLVLTGRNVGLPSTGYSDSLAPQIVDAIIKQADRSKKKNVGDSTGPTNLKPTQHN